MYVDSYGHSVEALLLLTSATRIKRHVKVKGTASPDDPSVAEYWAERAARKRGVEGGFDELECLSRLQGDLHERF